MINIVFIDAGDKSEVLKIGTGDYESYKRYYLAAKQYNYQKSFGGGIIKIGLLANEYKDVVSNLTGQKLISYISELAKQGKFQEGK